MSLNGLTKTLKNNKMEGMNNFDSFPDYLHPAKNFVPRGNPPKQETKSEPVEDMGSIDLPSLPRDALEALCRRLLCQCGQAATMTEDEIAQAMLDKLANGGLSQVDMFKALPMMREWFDRKRGKPAQSVAMTIEDKGLGKLQDDRLLRLERSLSRMTGEEAIVIPPEPKRLDDNTMA